MSFIEKFVVWRE